MVLKRYLGEGAEGGSRRPFKRYLKGSRLFGGFNHGRMLQESASCLEPMIRAIVREAVNQAIEPYLRISENRVNLPRRLQLQFCSNLPQTLFTNSRVQSNDQGPIRIALCDSITKEVITCGPLSSLKADVVVLDGDFGAGDREDWSTEEFDRKLVKSREGRRPLVTGELVVSLQNGIGYINNVCFTDNSSWIRSGKFRLGAKPITGSPDFSPVKEAFSNAFKVKDHRGQSYQKHYPPCLDDEVWRLEKISKDGSSHERLSQSGIHCVRDLLKLYYRDQSALRAILNKATKKGWEAIIGHAQKCTLDDKKYTYSTPQGAGLLFNSVNKVIGVTFNGRDYPSLNGLSPDQTKMLEHMKQLAYNNVSEWVPFCDPSIIGCPLLDAFAYPDPGLDKEINFHHPTMSPRHRVEPKNYELGESSNPGRGMGPTFKNDYETGYSSFDLYVEGEGTWASAGNCMGPHLSTDDLSLDDIFQVGSPVSHCSDSFLDTGNHLFGTIPSGSGILACMDRRPRARWCKVLAVVKWRILVRRHVAARKSRSSLGYV